MREPQEVCIPSTQRLSLIAMGIPASVVSWLVGWEINSALASAPLRSISRNALSDSFSRSAASRDNSTARRADISPLLISLASSVADVFPKSISRSPEQKTMYVQTNLTYARSRGPSRLELEPRELGSHARDLPVRKLGQRFPLRTSAHMTQ